jgi:hypothetical protein
MPPPRAGYIDGSRFIPQLTANSNLAVVDNTTGASKAPVLTGFVTPFSATSDALKLQPRRLTTPDGNGNNTDGPQLALWGPTAAAANHAHIYAGSNAAGFQLFDFAPTGAFTAPAMITSGTGRLMSQATTNPSVCCWDTSQGFAAGMLAGSGAALVFGSMDGNGNLVTAWMQIDTSNAANFWGSLTAHTVQSIGPVQASTGFQCKPGTGGGYRGNVFNIDWDGSAAQLYVDNTWLGTIAFSSDYRIKENVAPLPSTWDRVKALNPISYTQKDYSIARAAPGEKWGFIAHELQETLIADAATGVKDQADCIQSPNPWPVLATITRALQEAMTRIETLEGR